MQTSSVASSPIGVPDAGRMDPRAARILAETIYRDMKGYGIDADRILEVASELIGLVTTEIQAKPGRA